MKRRDFVRDLAYIGTTLSTTGLLTPSLLRANPGLQNLINKPIPKTQEPLNVIGMGAWISFNIGSIRRLRESRTAVLKAFFEAGGQMIDSSPMYGSAEDVVGQILSTLPSSLTQPMFAATKIWTSSSSEGREQFADSLRLWRRQRLALQQVHNLLAWREHLKFLKEQKEKGVIRYIGITTSHGRRHDDLEQIMRKESIDFVQLTYNPVQPAVERRLLPLAQDKGIAVIANRPFEGGEIIRAAKKRPLPPWATTLGCRNWADLILKYTVSHPAVTTAIPATSKVEHMKENMMAQQGRLLTQTERQKIQTLVRSL
ncbi:MAG: aldo/keto reductase [Pseudobacteriovorax sp.]|nr:aldo/keto reductase [Pseudobacteriovorax sp.]